MANRVFPYIKSAAPTANDDTGDGYKVGDIWLDTTNDLIYQAIDVTAAAAVWVEVVGRTLTQTLTNKILTAPTIADFTNAQHDHGDADNGGVIVSASTTVAGKVELAITSEIDTASDDTRAIPPGQFRTSKFAVQRRQGVVGNPNSWYTNIRAQIVMFRTDAAITITRIHIHGADTTPTSEMAGDLKFADDVNIGGFANATVIDVCDTTSGVFTATSSFDDATVPSGKYVYFQMDSAPHADWKDFFIEVHFTYD